MIDYYLRKLSIWAILKKVYFKIAFFKFKRRLKKTFLKRKRILKFYIMDMFNK